MLRQKTISGLKWSFLDSFANQGSQFIIGIILARLLVPRDFGLIGMLTFFIAISQSFIDSGFSQALIRKQDCRQVDFNTAFLFNLLVGIIFYLVLFFSAEFIARFFGEPQLFQLIRVLGLILLINAFGLIQRTLLTKEINFKLQTKISLIASFISGAIGIGMAVNGFGVWSLAYKTIAQQLVITLLFWLWNKWKPTLAFSFHAFKDLFRFGSKLLVSGIVDTTYRNIYYLIIGKYFSAADLGYYAKADEFNKIPSENLSGIIGRVSYPTLSCIQDDPARLKSAYKKLIQTTVYITFILMIGLAATAKKIILVLIGERWLQAVPYLQLLCFVGLMYPLHALNLNMLMVKGRSDLFLRLEVIKKILAVPVIVIGILFGIKIMIVGMIINSLLAYYLNSYWSGKLIGYSVREQIADIYSPFALAVVMGILTWLVGTVIKSGPVVVLISQLSIGGIVILVISEITKLKPYIELKSIVLESIRR